MTLNVSASSSSSFIDIKFKNEGVSNASTEDLSRDVNGRLQKLGLNDRKALVGSQELWSRLEQWMEPDSGSTLSFSDIWGGLTGHGVNGLRVLLIPEETRKVLANVFALELEKSPPPDPAPALKELHAFLQQLEADNKLEQGVVRPENPLPFTGCDKGEMAAFFLKGKGSNVASQKSDGELRPPIETSEKTQDKAPRTSTDFSKAELKTFHDALAGGKLKPLEDALKNRDLTAAQVYAVLAPKDDRTWATLRALIGKRTESPDELHQKRSAFKAYVALLKEHAPRLTASQLKDLYQYLHLSQTVKGVFWDSNSPGYDQLMEDWHLYHEYKDLKTLFKNATLPGRSELDMIYRNISGEIRTVARQLKGDALDDAQRHKLLVSGTADRPPLLQRLLDLPISSAFSIEYKRSAFRQYLALLAHHTPRLNPEQGKRLYRDLLGSQQVPVGLLGKTNSEGYRQVMQDKVVYQEYKMLKTCLKNGVRMEDTLLGRRFLADMQRFQDGPTWFTE